MTDFPAPPPPPPDHLMPPPGYVPYGGYGAVSGNFQKIGGLTKWLVGLMCVTAATQAISLLVQLTLRSKAADYLNSDISSSEFTDDIAVYALVALLAAGIAIGQLVVLIIWTFRMAKNHLVLGRSPQSFSAGATIAVNILGGCTLGIINFFMWREMWKASDPDTAPGDPSWKQRAVSPLVAAQLAITLGSVVLGVALGVSGINGIGTNTNSEDFAKNLDDKLGFVVGAGALGIASAVVFIMLVRQLGARHMKATREA
ncbi:MAG: hypothetical protein ABMA25_21165 [Ilumatobacteraceae bacterium]